MKGFLGRTPVFVRFLVLGIIILLGIYFLSTRPQSQMGDCRGADFGNLIVESPRGTILHTAVRQSQQERNKGLSVCKNLAGNQAMLFVFEEPYLQGFWMKDMHFAIDIFWLNENKEIVFIKEHAKPNDYPESYIPEVPALYVIETVAGFSEREKLKIGDQFEWEELAHL